MMFEEKFYSEKAKQLLMENTQVSYLLDKVVPNINDDEILGHVLFICPDMRLSELFIHMLSEKYARNIRVSDINIRASDITAIMTNMEHGDIWAVNNATIDLKLDALDSLKKILYLSCVDIIIGKGPSAQSIRINMPEFTFVACVEKESDDLTQLYPFFEHIIEIKGVEILKLSKQMYAGCESIIVTDDAYNLIWRAAGKDGRLAIKYLSRVLAFWKIKGCDQLITDGFVEQVFEMLEVNTTPEVVKEEIDQQILLKDIKHTLKHLKDEICDLKKEVEENKEICAERLSDLQNSIDEISDMY